MTSQTDYEETPMPDEDGLEAEGVAPPTDTLLAGLPRVPAGVRDVPRPYIVPGGDEPRVRTDASRRGVPVYNNDGTACYAGLHEAEWAVWEAEAEGINRAAEGKLSPADADSAGRRLRAAGVEEFRRLAERIQAVASSYAVDPVTVPALWRTESHPNKVAALAGYRPGGRAVLAGLTAASALPEFAGRRAQEEAAAGRYPVVLRYHNPHGLRGVQAAPLGAPSHSVVMPRGLAFRVTRVADLGSHAEVWLASSEVHSVPRVNAAPPPAGT